MSSKIDEIRARLEAALGTNPAPWSSEWTGQQFSVSDARGEEIIEQTFAIPTWGERYEQAKATCDVDTALMIAHAPADIAYLLARVAELEAGSREQATTEGEYTIEPHLLNLRPKHLYQPAWQDGHGPEVCGLCCVAKHYHPNHGGQERKNNGNESPGV
jgi:hypothetical protein